MDHTTRIGWHRATFPGGHTLYISPEDWIISSQEGDSGWTVADPDGNIESRSNREHLIFDTVPAAKMWIKRRLRELRR